MSLNRVLCTALCVCSLGGAAVGKDSGQKRAEKEYESAKHLLSKGDFDAAIEHGQAAQDADPLDVRYAAFTELARQVRSTQALKQAEGLRKVGKSKEAADLLQKALGHDPQNPELAAAARDNAMQAFPLPQNLQVRPEQPMIDAPTLQPKDRELKRDFHLRGTGADVLQQFFRQYGIATEMHPSVKQRQVRFDVTQTDYDTALSTLLAITHTFIVPASAKQVYVFDDTQENRNANEHLYMQTFDVRGVGSAQELNELTNALRGIFVFRSIGQTASGKLAIKGTREQIEEANRFIEMALQPSPEVMLDVNEYEISESLARQVGASVPLQFSVVNVNTELQNLGIQNPSDLVNQLLSGNISASNLSLLAGLLAQGQTTALLTQSGFTFGGGRTREAVLIPANVQLNLNDQKNSAKTLENDSLRVQSGTTANLHNGLRFPIVTTTFSSLLNNAVASRLAQNQLFQTPAPAVEYVDLGTTLKVTPLIQSDRNVKLQFSLQVRNIAGTGVNGIPVIGNREYNGVVNLRQGESAVIAGTIEDSDAINNSGIPGLSSIPGLAAAGGTINHNRQRNQVLITITPRAVIIPERKTVTFPTID